VVADLEAPGMVESQPHGTSLTRRAPADHLAVTLPAVDKHLRVLLDAGVVTKQKSGRTTAVKLVPGSLEELGVWAMSTRLMWGNALDRLEQHLAAEPMREEAR
jgi:DNA-binding transcriptional ArsR family regulator